MREVYTEEFYARYKMAYLNYEAGNWAVAKVMLEETRFLLNIEDGASHALLRLIHHYHYEVPKDWQGFRKFGVAAREALPRVHVGSAFGSFTSGGPARSLSS